VRCIVRRVQFTGEKYAAARWGAGVSAKWRPNEYCNGKAQPSGERLELLIALIVREQAHLIAENRDLRARLAAMN
jgi:hypothetical protein